MGMQASVKRQLALLMGGKYSAMVRAAGQVMPQSKELKNKRKWGLRQPEPVVVLAVAVRDADIDGVRHGRRTVTGKPELSTGSAPFLPLSPDDTTAR
mgnify:CR=1 FL=1